MPPFLDGHHKSANARHGVEQVPVEPIKIEPAVRRSNRSSRITFSASTAPAFKMLKRHVSTDHQMKWDLPPSAFALNRSIDLIRSPTPAVKAYSPWYQVFPKALSIPVS
jgi:hypothetical protein